MWRYNHVQALPCVHARQAEQSPTWLSQKQVPRVARMRNFVNFEVHGLSGQVGPERHLGGQLAAGCRLV